MLKRIDFLLILFLSYLGAFDAEYILAILLLSVKSLFLLSVRFIASTNEMVIEDKRPRDRRMKGMEQTVRSRGAPTERWW